MYTCLKRGNKHSITKPKLISEACWMVVAAAQIEGKINIIIATIWCSSQSNSIIEVVYYMAKLD
jgi:hypothetical protein